jgi:hypothetical protein
VTISTKVATFSPKATKSLLASINSPANPNDPQPPSGLCASAVFAPMCAKSFKGWSVKGGCNTVAERCSPPEMSVDSCITRNATAGAFVMSAPPSTRAGATDAADALDAEEAASAKVNPDTPPPRPHQPKQAQFVGCCVSSKVERGAYGRMTCKRIRVGAKWLAGGAVSGDGASGRKLLTHPVMNPYKQMRSCQCFNIREYVHMDMFAKRQRNPPQHILAPYPFTVGITAKVRLGGAFAAPRRAPPRPAAPPPPPLPLPPPSSRPGFL